MEKPGNYTPIEQNSVKKRSVTGSGFHSAFMFILSNGAAFSIAAIIVVFAYGNKLLSQKQIINSKASQIHYGFYCIDNNIKNPDDVKVWAVDKTTGVNAYVGTGSIVNSDAVTFEWTKIPGAVAYYIALSTDPKSVTGAVDPVEVGQHIEQNYYTFKDLKPHTTYYLLIRSKSASNHVGVVFPTPDNCGYPSTGYPLFIFSTP